jgi:alpha-ketoglutarate-dependent taurine dioxygenase
VAIAAERIRTISVTRLHPVIGAEIGGVDLCRPLDAETLRQIKDAWHEHTVLLFRGQSLSEDDQRRFASYFGPVAKRVPPKPGATGVGDAPAFESEALLQRLFEIAEDPAIIYEHVWRVGDLIMWDNLACLHARTDWPSEQRRTLRRCTVEGEPLY